MKRIGLIALAGAVVASIALADDTGSTKGWRGSGAKKGSAATSNAAESGLIGVKLYDTGLRVIQLYGSPDEIQDVASGGGTAIGPAGGAGAAGARGGAAGGGNRRGGGGGGGGGESSRGAEWNIPDLDYYPINFQGEPPPRIGGAQNGSSGGGSIPAAGGGGGQPAGGGGGGAAAGGTADGRIVYTRWVYRKGNSRYAFILNRYNQVIQIEAIGSNDPRVSTNRGIRYGAQFADIMKKYGAPDGYEINGNTLVLRYLVNSKVAFRMNRLKTDGKHVVTGVVVAAGKM